ncbi:MAG: S49 family peptidase, partial [Phascolarctobacterium sp.]|nr:S49 family peptidase [Phascolarctobacterium sp.]
QRIVNEIYENFIATVAAGRKMDAGKLRSYADGRIYTGAQAKNIGLIDEVGNYYDALEATGRMAGFDGVPPVKEREQKQPWEILLGAEIAKTLKVQFFEQVLGDLGASPRIAR